VADRVRTKSGEFPVTPELVLALLAGFAAFNQALWAALSWLMALDDQVDLADRFLVISLVVGGVTWLLATVAQVRAGAVTISDKLIIGATLALVGIGVAMGSSVCALIGTIGMLAWGARGWFRPRRAPDASSLQNE
jgi:hypothetical protein